MSTRNLGGNISAGRFEEGRNSGCNGEALRKSRLGVSGHPRNLAAMILKQNADATAIELRRETLTAGAHC